MNKTLRKSNNRIICGVCGGVAEYFGWDTSLVRIAVAVLCAVSGVGVIAYIAGAIVMPDAPSEDGGVVDADYRDM